ncbi:sensor histidine kinase [bacterium]|nr:sensor histidine kinase [bacterium]
MENIKPIETKNLSDLRLLSLINNMSDGVIAVDDSLNVSIYNASSLNLLDLNLIKEKSNISKVLKLVNKKGESVDVERLISKVKFPSVNRDLIERDDFISVVSHELRTPIAVSEGALSNALFLLSKSSSYTEIEKALADAHKQILYLGDLVNDLSSLSRAEQGKFTGKIDNINIPILFKELETEFKDQALEKHLKLNFKLDPHLELIKTSKLYLKEILENLITNALKYTPSGSINIEAKRDNNSIIFSVEDTGIGIGHMDQEKVFNKFFRSEDFRTASTKGTGLGLYISAKLAKLIGSNINLSSELNKGSVFSLNVPNLN